MLLLIWLSISLCASALLLYLNGYTLLPMQMLQIVTGNFIMDALIVLIFMSHYLLIINSLVVKILQQIIHIKFFWGFLISLALTYSILSFVAIISQLTVPLLPFFLDTSFQYIGLSLGTTFWAMFFSVLSYYRVKNIILKNVLAFGICSPIILVPIIPWTLDLNGLSWVHLYD